MGSEIGRSAHGDDDDVGGPVDWRGQFVYSNGDGSDGGGDVRTAAVIDGGGVARKAAAAVDFVD